MGELELPRGVHLGLGVVVNFWGVWVGGPRHARAMLATAVVDATHALGGRTAKDRAGSGAEKEDREPPGGGEGRKRMKQKRVPGGTLDAACLRSAMFESC